MKGNAIIGQSGGPTAVINASLAAVIEKSLATRCFNNIYGMCYGIEGLMSDQLINLSAQDSQTIASLKMTPSSILGSSRYGVAEKDYDKIIAQLKKYDIRTFFQIGGNGSMTTLHKIGQFARSNGYQLQVIGIPKTVDNDLTGTDHAPGFPSAARYNALSVQQVGRLFKDMKKVDQFFIHQSIGRHAGWLTAATAFARQESDDAPHLIYLPERRLNRKRFIDDVKSIIKKYGWVGIAVSEGLVWEDGTPVSATETTDTSGNVEFGAAAGGSVAMQLHKIVSQATGLRGEFQVTESLPMCAIDRVSPVDMDEASQCGTKAVELAQSGATGVMVSINRINNAPYQVRYQPIPIADIAGTSRPMDDHYINEAGNYVTEAFMEYMHPIIGTIPPYCVLKRIMA